MFSRAVFSAMLCSAPFIVISDKAPNWGIVLAWLYILAMIAVGVMALKAKRISAWCDKQLAKKNDKNAP